MGDASPALHRAALARRGSPRSALADWWGPMPDPFDPRFAEAADKMARNAAARFRGDPWLIGYFVDNELSWGRGSSTDPQEYYALAINALAARSGEPGEIRLRRAADRDLSRTGTPRTGLGHIRLTSWDELRSAGFALPPASLRQSCGDPRSGGVHSAVCRSLLSHGRRGLASPRSRPPLSRQPFRLADRRGGRGLRPLVRRRQLQSLQAIDRR